MASLVAEINQNVIDAQFQAIVHADVRNPDPVLAFKVRNGFRVQPLHEVDEVLSRWWFGEKSLARDGMTNDPAGHYVIADRVIGMMVAVHDEGNVAE